MPRIFPNLTHTTNIQTHSVKQLVIVLLCCLAPAAALCDCYNCDGSAGCWGEQQLQIWQTHTHGCVTTGNWMLLTDDTIFLSFNLWRVITFPLPFLNSSGQEFMEQSVSVWLKYCSALWTLMDMGPSFPCWTHTNTHLFQITYFWFQQCTLTKQLWDLEMIII